MPTRNAAFVAAELKDPAETDEIMPHPNKHAARSWQLKTPENNSHGSDLEVEQVFVAWMTPRRLPEANGHVFGKTPRP